jgi:hypothetical protein
LVRGQQLEDQALDHATEIAAIMTQIDQREVGH